MLCWVSVTKTAFRRVGDFNLFAGHTEETVSKKKKHLNEAELALKREETARKRKNLSVKKLEDEKVSSSVLHITRQN